MGLILTKNKLFSGILLFSLVSILLVAFNIQSFYLRAILSFIFLTTIPGLLIMLMLKIRKIGFLEYLVYTIGLSIAFIMFAGLAVNWILPWLHITDKPLSLNPLLISFGGLLSIFGIIAYLRNKDLSLKIKFPKLDWLNKVFFTIPIIFPILSILGAITLNNGGPNYLTMIMLGGIAIYVFLVVLLREKLNEHVFPWAILFTSISLLLMYPLRSWHILGWDINQEYLVFALTNSTKYWSAHTLNSAYNLCLSITILPTILESFLKINNEYIYKLIFPILFSTVPLIVYLTAKKILNIGYAFLSAAFFISQIWFIEQMPALARQEIALIFFAGLLMIKFDHRLSQINKNILSIIFGISIIVSHYSTAYVWIAIMIIYYFINNIVKITKINNLKLLFSLKYIILMIAIVFLWGSQLTNSNGNFRNFLTITITNISKGFSADMINGGLERLTFKNVNINNPLNVAENYQTMSQEYLKKRLILYPKETYQDYKPEPIFSKYITNPAFDNTRLPISQILKIIKLILNDILPIIGIFYFLRRYLFKYSKGNTNDFLNINRDKGINVLLLGISTLPLIFMIIFLPFIATQYNSTRLYMQSLIILSNLTIVGGMYLLSKLRIKKLSYTIMVSLIILFFLYSSGFFFQIVGGEPLLLLNNFGGEYDQFYTTQPETNSIKWFTNNKASNSMLYADQLAGLRLTSFGQIINYNFDILPSTIDKRSYVYLSNTNVQKGKVYKRYDTDQLEYTTPIKFLNSNKNLVYNNGGSEIFK